MGFLKEMALMPYAVIRAVFEIITGFGESFIESFVMFLAITLTGWAFWELMFWLFIFVEIGIK